MRLFLLLFFSGTIFALLFNGCAKEKAELYSVSSCDTTNVSYNDTIQPIINRACAYAGCHVSGGSGNGDFATYLGVQLKVNNGSFENRVYQSKDMPPTFSTPQLTDCEKALLKAWINNGAPNN